MDRLLRLTRIAKSSVPPLKVRLGTLLLIVAVIAAFLAYLTDQWRREAREAEARRLVILSGARKQRADNYRESRRHHLDLLDRLRQSALNARPGIGRPVRIGPRGGVDYLATLQAQIDFTAQTAAWEEQMAGLLDWAADHPAEPLRPAQPMPIPWNEGSMGRTPAPAQSPVKPPVDPGNIGRYAVPRVIKNPE